jgi:Flp pilus assembly protein TadG
MNVIRYLVGLRQRLRRFGANQGANVTMTFALATVPMVGFVGAAIDYSHANAVKVSMQAAVDSTALMLSKVAVTLTESQLQPKAAEYFNALFVRPDATGVQVTVNYNTTSGSQLKIIATGNVKTNFMGIMGHTYLQVRAESQVKWGNTRLRIALALDNTGSMDADGKMTALKTATKGLLTQLKNAASKDGDVYVSIIPFNRDVNVGASNYTENWIKWSGQSDTFDENNGTCTGHSWGTPKSKSVCLDRDGTWTPADHNTWNGCVMDRDQDYDTKNTAPDPATPATLFPAHQYSSCPTKLLAQTYDWVALNNKVDAMTPVGNTNQTIGMQWAFQSLTGAPFVIPAKDPNYQYKDIIILMSDGLNTQNRFSSSQSSIDTRMAKACTNAKTAGIVVYTIQVNTGGDPTQDVLKNCASGLDKFFLLTSASQMVSTFQTIGTALTNLRIAM